MANIFQRLLTIGEGKQLRVYEGVVSRVNELEEGLLPLTDTELAARTVAFRERLDNGQQLDELLPEAFAVTREASRRALGMRHFDVQLIGGMVLNDGMIAEMKTGEGKTLVSTLAGYLNALPGNGVHVVTVNDYLAKRDSEWMGRIYRFLGMDVGMIQSQMDPSRRKPAYLADVTYGTNSEFGFDYLRDNMVTRPGDRVQRGHHFAVVDEVDSILIDEARTPLIISGAGTKSADLYKSFAKAIPRLREGIDFELEEAKRTVAATEVGLAKVEQALGIDDIYGDPSGQLVNHLQQALKAQFLFKRDVDYVVKDGEVLIVDEFTGRLMYGRRYSEGLHQALEAKERVHVQEENQTLATITLQNYFRMYDKLSGMTGTAITEDKEFRDIYSLPVMVIPTNRPMVRADENDLIYRTVEAKFGAVVDDIEVRHAAGQPCLVGTISIENSERLARLLVKRGIPHKVLNAKFHEQEAHIIAQAGRLGAVTIATNMAGRGTDIILGGNPELLWEEIVREKGVQPEDATEEQRADALVEAKRICAAEHEAVVNAGGLAVLGTERHESRRIDNQLRGRSGRQGDPGVSQFYLSLADDLMRLFGGDRMDRISAFMQKTQVPDDMPIQAGLVSKAIESAQRQVEAMNFAARKHVLEYDDVMNKQREVIYAERQRILDGKDIHARVEEMMSDVITGNVLVMAPEKTYAEEWDWDEITTWYKDLTGDASAVAAARGEVESPFELAERLSEHALSIYATKEQELGADELRGLERAVMLRIIDARWMEHLQEMDYLREGIGLRAMGQRDPQVEYKNEAYDMFAGLVQGVNESFLRTIMHLQITVAEAEPEPALRNVNYSAPSESSIFGGATEAAAAAQAAGVGGPSPDAIAAAAAAAGGKGRAETVTKDKEDPWADVGRNDPCPCGSGKKYKRCHGAAE